MTRLRESSSGNNVPAWLNGQCIHLPVHPSLLSKRTIQGAICIQSRDVITDNAIDRAKAAADYDLAVRLHNGGEDFAIYTFARAEG